MAEETWYACENNHPVLSGSTICATCGGQVTSKKVPPPRETGAGQIIRKQPFVLVALAAGIAIAGGVLALVLAQSSLTADPTPSPTVIPTTCTGVGPELDMGVEYEGAPVVSCFVVDEETVVTIAAQSSASEALGIEVERVDGVFWAGTPGAEGIDPVVSSTFLPGAYVVTVTLFGEDAPAPFTLSIDAEETDPWNTSDPDLPGLDDCGTGEIPFLELDADAAQLRSDDYLGYACLVVDEAAFVKVGAETGTGNVVDLNLAVHEFGSDGRPVFVRSVNDTFGNDPEMSLDLEAGTYLVEVAGWMGEPVGEYALYASTDPEFSRVGEVSEEWAHLTLSYCSSDIASTIEIGRPLIFDESDPLACLEVAETQRLVLEAVTFSDQDLILEVIGFREDGSPFRFAWIDDDLWAADWDDVDPVLDTYVPAGTYILAIGEFWDETPREFMISVSEAVG